MAVLMKGLQQILRCKHCQQFPNTLLSVKSVPSWNGGTASMYNVVVSCPTDPGLFTECNTYNEEYSYASAYNYWNSTYGEKP